MEEIIQNLNPDIKNNILEKDLEEEKTKKESFEEELKKIFPKRFLKDKKRLKNQKLNKKPKQNSQKR
ncbi:hypothetical protein [Aliarcobacter cryaerophilus]|uniref:hypothetical protein n=1 Tax=Aliarcobacter cryaerophilus TaxID=28198 RepID=UPI002095FACC|nr:hypothetical protein [Aliarcobacter cryaerophilus]